MQQQNHQRASGGSRRRGNASHPREPSSAASDDYATLPLGARASPEFPNGDGAQDHDAGPGSGGLPEPSALSDSPAAIMTQMGLFRFLDPPPNGGGGGGDGGESGGLGRWDDDDELAGGSPRSPLINCAGWHQAGYYYVVSPERDISNGPADETQAPGRCAEEDAPESTARAALGCLLSMLGSMAAASRRLLSACCVGRGDHRAREALGTLLTLGVLAPLASYAIWIFITALAPSPGGAVDAHYVHASWRSCRERRALASILVPAHPQQRQRPQRRDGGGPLPLWQEADEMWMGHGGEGGSIRAAVESHLSSLSRPRGGGGATDWSDDDEGGAHRLSVLYIGGTVDDLAAELGALRGLDYPTRDGRPWVPASSVRVYFHGAVLSECSFVGRGVSPMEGDEALSDALDAALPPAGPGVTSGGQGPAPDSGGTGELEPHHAAALERARAMLCFHVTLERARALDAGAHSVVDGTFDEASVCAGPLAGQQQQQWALPRAAWLPTALWIDRNAGGGRASRASHARVESQPKRVIIPEGGYDVVVVGGGHAIAAMDTPWPAEGGGGFDGGSLVGVGPGLERILSLASAGASEPGEGEGVGPVPGGGGGVEDATLNPILGWIQSLVQAPPPQKHGLGGEAMRKARPRPWATVSVAFVHTSLGEDNPTPWEEDFYRSLPLHGGGAPGEGPGDGAPRLHISPVGYYTPGVQRLYTLVESARDLGCIEHIVARGWALGVFEAYLRWAGWREGHDRACLAFASVVRGEAMISRVLLRVEAGVLE